MYKKLLGVLFIIALFLTAYYFLNKYPFDIAKRTLQFSNSDFYNKETVAPDYKMFGIEGIVVDKRRNKDGEWIVYLKGVSYSRLGILLGASLDKKGVWYVESYALPRKSNWEDDTVNNIVSHIRKNEPIIVMVSYGWNADSLSSACSDSQCQRFLSQIAKDQSQTERIIADLKVNRKIDKNSILVGAVQFIVKK